MDMETGYTFKSDEGNLIGSLKQFKKAAVVALTQVSALWERRMLRYK